MLLLLLGQVTGLDLGALRGGDQCEENCEDEASGKSCPPACSTCSCTMRSAQPMLASHATTLVIPSIARVEVAPPPSQPASPDPREILHVPKSLVA